VNGAKGFTLKNCRIMDFEGQNANGILGTENNSGVLSVENVEIARCGGVQSGLAHHFYINASKTDLNFTFRVRGLYSHDSNLGHLLKSRAQVTDIQDSWLIGGLPRAPHVVAEPYCVDVPNGGILTLKRNVLVKNASAGGSNGACMTFGVEGVLAEKMLGRSQIATISDNIFVAFAKTYDGSHPIWPLFFYKNGDPRVLPAFTVPTQAGGVIAPTIAVDDNTFIGFQTPLQWGLDYRGANPHILGFDALQPDYTVK